MKPNKKENLSQSRYFYFKAAALGVAIIAFVSSFIYQLTDFQKTEINNDDPLMIKEFFHFDSEKKREILEDWDEVTKSFQNIREHSSN